MEGKAFPFSHLETDCTEISKYSANSCCVVFDIFLILFKCSLNCHPIKAPPRLMIIL